MGDTVQASGSTLRGAAGESVALPVLGRTTRLLPGNVVALMDVWILLAILWTSRIVTTNIDPTACTQPQNYIFPVFEYGHVNGRCSLTGGYVYRGVEQTLTAGTYIYGDFCTGEILAWNGSTQSVLLDSDFRISSFGEDGSGELYVTDITNGTVYRIDNTAPPPPPPCTYSITPTEASYGKPGGTGTVTVTAPEGCAWTAVSNASWITVTSGASGTANGTVGYSVASIKPKRRTGTMTIAGQTFTVSQSK